MSELESNILFSEIAQELAARYANPKNIIGKREGDVIFQKGDPCEYFYLLIEGIVKLKYTEPDGTNIYLEKGKNTFFGETELLAKSPRKTSAVADTDCRMYTFNLSELKSLVKADRKVLQNLQSNLSFYISEEDFLNYTKDFVVPEDKPSDLLDPTGNISNNEMEISPGDSQQTDGENKPGQDIPNQTEISVDITDERDDNLIITEPVQEEENQAYIMNPDPLIEEEDDDDDQQNIVDENSESESITESIEKEYKPSFTDIGFDDTIEEEIPEENTGNVEAGVEEERAQKHESSSFQNIEETSHDIDAPTKEEILDEEYQGPPEITDPAIWADDRTPAFYKGIINRIQNIFSSVNIDEIINIISEEAAGLVNAEGGVLYMVDGENGELVSKILSGNSISDIRMKLSDGLQGIAAAEKRNIFLDNPQQEKYYNPVIEDLTGISVKNSLYYPLIRSNNETAAVLELYNSGRGKFNQTDVEILNEISGSALKAINNAKLTNIFHQQKRISSLGEIINFISGDIKNPLLFVKHYASVIKKKKLSPELNQILDLQIEQVNAAEDFLRSTEAYAKAQNILELKTTRISEALNSILGLLAEYVESRNTVIYSKTETDAVVNLDNRLFYQACYQIVKNACDEMYGEGKIYVTIEADGEYIKIKFRDTGKGVPESWKEKIFKPFVSRKKNKAGLGLTIADKIIADHGGYILVDSVTGQGATFSIALPIVF